MSVEAENGTNEVEDKHVDVVTQTLLDFGKTGVSVVPLSTEIQFYYAINWIKYSFKTKTSASFFQWLGGSDVRGCVSCYTYGVSIELFIPLAC